MAKRPYVLSIAGIDPSAGAGLLADIKTFERLGMYGLGIPSANTIQTEDDFFHNQWLPSHYMLEGVKKMLETYPVAAVKIGIIENSRILEMVTEWIKRYNAEIQIVWDPVMRSSTNHDFQQYWQLSRSLLDNIDIITPNREEWEKLKGALPEDNSAAVLIKGGHNLDKKGYDMLISKGVSTEIPPLSDLPMSQKHGSGCVYSSALTSFLAKGDNLLKACESAKGYTEMFLASNTSKLGYHYGEASIYIAG